MPYGRILNEKIVKPLGLKETLVGSKIASQHNESCSYELKDENWVLQPETDLSIPLGAGAVVSTPADLNLFIYGLFNGKLISAESVKKMQTLVDGYGLGLVQVPFYGQIGYGHGGGIDGFRSFLVYYPEDNVAVAYTSNGSNYDNNNVTIALLSSIYNKPYDIPDFTSIDKDLDHYPGVYSSTGFPLKITITKSGNGIIAQATGQPSFPLKASGNNIYTFDVAGIALHFNPGMKQMTLKQGGKEFVLTKE
jgi:D-alanyl-D-alanine carboxypeptidase